MTEQSKKEIKILYKNYRGEVAHRRIIPKSITFTSNEWHPEKQFLLTALDVEKGEDRHFAMKDIQECEGNEEISLLMTV